MRSQLESAARGQDYGYAHHCWPNQTLGHAPCCEKALMWLALRAICCPHKEHDATPEQHADCMELHLQVPCKRLPMHP